ncbi:acyl-CoA dehydrogenase family protein, partial [Curtobacterium flaccumfaciens]|uniref:acyl-CoA dehydrogenase family protein n=1 Tax=Curtobacterium flaccumfaciens TaxID=2035 RepID=UPI003CEAB000
MRRLGRLGVAIELTGCLDAALHAVVTHVSDRRQFGRPLGAFQAVQHRLAAAAVQVEAGRWLALQAAHSGRDADAACA